MGNFPKRVRDIEGNEFAFKCEVAGLEDFPIYGVSGGSSYGEKHISGRELRNPNIFAIIEE